MDLQTLTPGLVLLCVLLASAVSAKRYDGDDDDEKYMPPDCKPCESRTCPILTFCAGGVVVKDHCGCCPRCSSDLFQPHQALPPAKNKGNACEEVKCQRFKVCMVNIQGLPLCMCPSNYICRTKKRKQASADLSMCGSDGVTYETRCHLRIADCNSRKRIKVAHKGSCDATPSVQLPEKKTNTEIVREETPVDREERIKSIVKETKKRDRRRRKKRRQRRHNKHRLSKYDRKYGQLRGRKNRRGRKYFNRY